MIVLKFGGTSVGSAESLSFVKEIVQRNYSQKKKQVVVVSALGDITNSLVDISHLAAAGNEYYVDLFNEIEQRHLQLCNEIIPLANRSATLTQTKVLLNDLEDILRGLFLVGELSPRSSDLVLSFGERLASTIISAFLSEAIPKTILCDAREYIKTDAQFGNAIVDAPLTYELLVKQITDTNDLYLFPGFVASSNQTNQITTLGRGGSDYTAALIAAAVNAEELQIWTDVSGMMTANPRMVSRARTIDSLSYEEAMELSHFGAKVIYPPTIQPVLDAQIPVWIKNTFLAEDKGTCITVDGSAAEDPVRGISSIEEVSLCTLSGSGMVAVPNFSYRLFSALSKASINVIMITQASSEHTITVGVSKFEAERATDVIEAEFQNEINQRKVNRLRVEKELSIIALVGSRMREQVGISSTLFDALSHNGINVKAIAQGSTELNISVVIDRKNLKKALNTLHESFFLSDTKKYSLFLVGVGNVGQTLLQQIHQQKDFLSQELKIDIRLCGLANSRSMLFNSNGIDMTASKEKLEEHGVAMSMDAFYAQMVEMNLRNSIFIDCTATYDIPTYYQSILRQSISIVTPNKVACSSHFDHYLDLKKTATKYHARFLFETNVGAGLPVISTAGDLLKSGDKVSRIEAVLSGTLNFLFNHYDATVPFQEVLKRAKDEGYTEPDPKIDLSGIDVQRKILILARESGHKLELDEIQNRSFLPDDCLETQTVEELYKRLLEHEDHFKQLFKKANEQGKKLKFVASFDKESGHAEIGLQAYSAEHPFYSLKGKDNVVLFYTKRYHDYPLIVQGAGAGSAVTASGIFADILRIADA